MSMRELTREQDAENERHDHLADEAARHEENIASKMRRYRAARGLINTTYRLRLGLPDPVTHTGMLAHDGYAPHSHEVRPDHAGVRKDRQP